MLDLISIWEDISSIAKQSYFSFLVAIFVTALFLSLLQPLALRLGLVDTPNHRKKHIGSIPLVGGIAMFLGFVFSLVTLDTNLFDYRSFVTISALLVIVGVLDDFHELRPRGKFFTQIVAAVLMVVWGDVIIYWVGPLIPGQNPFLGIFAIPLTIVGVLAVINAINMSDGVDGLAGTYVLIALISIAVLATQTYSTIATKVIFLLILIVFVFLCFNIKTPWRKNAAVFMGDAGSMFLGFALVWFAIYFSQGEDRAMNPVTSLWLVALPLFDLAGVTIRRVIRRKPVFGADREHFHHVLLAAGCSPTKTLIVLASLSVVFASIGLIGHHFEVADGVMFGLFVMLFLLYFVGMMKAWVLTKAIRKL
jgi:UDP-GlcNAc:undecaprenyl-phosphate/decaprenyl-phosphate GlcNAc-1-phosphate transferase